MRIWLRIPDEPLRRALSDLLAHAGHDVSTAAAPSAHADLHIVAGSRGADGSLRPGAAVLVLGDRARNGEASDPVAALVEALARGGRAFWPSPLAPARLLAVLAATGAAPPAPARDELPTDSPLLWAHDPWLLLDPVRRRVLWANAAARAGLGFTADDAGDALKRHPLAAVMGAVFDRMEGRRRVDHEGRGFIALWWTDARGRRALGLLDVPQPAREDPQGNLRTLAEIGRLTSTLAHEIRNPLAALAGAIDLLEHDAEASERAEVLTLARQRLGQMKTLLDDTLRLARPFKERPAPLDTAAVIRSAIEGARPDPLFRHVQLHADLGVEAVTAMGHEVALRQAMTNLLLNAAQAQEGRGSITIRLTQEDGFAVVRILDEGPGIPPERREKIFEPFWTTKTSGTGLGLSYVRRVADASGGRVLAEDAARGACIRLDLPLVP